MYDLFAISSSLFHETCSSYFFFTMLSKVGNERSEIDMIAEIFNLLIPTLCRDDVIV